MPASQRLEACVRGGSILTSLSAPNYSCVCPNFLSYHLKGEGAPFPFSRLFHQPLPSESSFHPFPSSHLHQGHPDNIPVLWKHVKSVTTVQSLFCFLSFSGSISGSLIMCSVLKCTNSLCTRKHSKHLRSISCI